MKLGLLGHKGMLGGMADRYFKSQGYDVILSDYETKSKITANWSNFDSVADLVGPFKDCDYILNCIGAIKPKFLALDGIANSIYVNAIFPRLLANVCDLRDKPIKLIHITTDCVFDGRRGQYDETMPHDATDDYGKSKSLGEAANAMVIRTSIIGPEWHGNKRSLIEWLVSKNGSKVDGYLNHNWNGLTTLEFCKMVDKIIQRNEYQWDNFHLYSTDVTKYELLQKMITAFDLNITVHPTNGAQNCDRTLRTIKQWQYTLQPASLDDMLKEVAPFVSTL
jgi:dTDP-4-dehydrorhamnose reductase